MLGWGVTLSMAPFLPVCVPMHGCTLYSTSKQVDLRRIGLNMVVKDIAQEHFRVSLPLDRLFSPVGWSDFERKNVYTFQVVPNC